MQLSSLDGDLTSLTVFMRDHGSLGVSQRPLPCHSRDVALYLFALECPGNLDCSGNKGVDAEPKRTYGAVKTWDLEASGIE